MKKETKANVGSNSKSNAVLSGLNQGGTIGASGSNPGIGTAKAWATQPVKNDYGFKDANGKPYGPTLTGAQFDSAIQDTKNNAEAINAAKEAFPAYIHQYTGVAISKAGTITGAEAKALQQFAQKQATSGQAFSFQQAAADIQAGNASTSLSFPTNYTNTSYDQPNVNASNKVVNDLFLNFLGRGATDAELKAYATSYLNYAKTNPTSQTVGQNFYTQTDIGRLKTSQASTSVTTGLDEKAFVENQVRNSGNYNAYTAASTAFDLMQKLAASNRAGV